jgi:hypothetical protein
MQNQFIHRTGFTPYKLGFSDGLNARPKSKPISQSNHSKDYLDGYKDGDWTAYCQTQNLNLINK